MNLRDLVDSINAPGALYGEIAGPAGCTYFIELQKRDLLAQMRGRYSVDGKPDYKAETGMTIDASVPNARLLTVEQAKVELSPLEQYNLDRPLPFMQYASSNDYEDVSIQELARESMDDSRQSGETERARLICEAAMRRKKGIAEATAYVDRIMPRPAYMMAAKFNYETREFEDQATAA